MDAQISFTLSLFNSKTDTQPEEVQRSWAQMCARFERPIVREAKDGTLFSPAVFRPAYRLQDNVIELSLLVLDYDHHASFEDDLRPWRALGCSFAAYTTHSHRRTTKSNPGAEERFRVVVPLAVPIPADRFPALWQWAARKSGDKVDVQAQDASRMYYTPVITSPNAPYQVDIVEGEPFDWRSLDLDDSPKPEASGYELPLASTVNEFNSWDELHAEAARRIRQTAKAHTNRKGWTHAPGICHGSTDGKAVFVSPDGAYGCHKGCPTSDVRVAHGLSERPNTPEPERGQQSNGGSVSKPAPRFILTTLDELLSEPEEQVAYVWDRTLPVGGISICAAKPKVGKSTLARNLAVAITRSEAFFGRATAKGKVIYLCLEEKRAEVAAHFRRMGAQGPDIFIHTGRAPDDALAALQEAIDEFNPSLVIVDPLARFVRVRDFNDYAEMARGMEPLIDLARVTGCHILCVHHCGKGEREGGDALLGSTALFGAVDTVLIMKRREQARTLHTIQRYGEDMPETVAYLDPETGLVTAGGDLAALQINDRKQAVLEAMGEESLTEPDIKERVGGNQTTTSKAIRSLHESGTLLRVGAGKRGDPYRYQKGEAVAEKSSILDSTNIGNRENRENLDSKGDDGEPEWLVDIEATGWMRDEPDEVRERAAILEIDYLVPCEESQRLARESLETASL
jgi:hypothetical protein